MPVELVFARQERPVGLSTLEQVRALKDEAEAAASTAATAAVEAAGPAIAEAVQEAAGQAATDAAEQAAAAVAPAAAEAIRAQVAADADRAEAAAGTAATEAATLAAQQAAEQAAPIAAAAVRAEVQADAQTAQTAAGTATTEANRATLAANTAAVNANVYTDVTAGRAAVADGGQFQVVVGDEIVRYRRNSATTQTEVARFPSAAKVDAASARVEASKARQDRAVAKADGILASVQRGVDLGVDFFGTTNGTEAQAVSTPPMNKVAGSFIVQDGRAVTAAGASLTAPAIMTHDPAYAKASARVTIQRAGNDEAARRTGVLIAANGAASLLWWGYRPSNGALELWRMDAGAAAGPANTIPTGLVAGQSWTITVERGTGKATRAIVEMDNGKRFVSPWTTRPEDWPATWGVVGAQAGGSISMIEVLTSYSTVIDRLSTAERKLRRESALAGVAPAGNHFNDRAWQSTIVKDGRAFDLRAEQSETVLVDYFNSLDGTPVGSGATGQHVPDFSREYMPAGYTVWGTMPFQTLDGGLAGVPPMSQAQYHGTGVAALTWPISRQWMESCKGVEISFSIDTGAFMGGRAGAFIRVPGRAYMVWVEATNLRIGWRGDAFASTGSGGENIVTIPHGLTWPQKDLRVVVRVYEDGGILAQIGNRTLAWGFVTNPKGLAGRPVEEIGVFMDPRFGGAQDQDAIRFRDLHIRPVPAVGASRWRSTPPEAKPVVPKFTKQGLMFDIANAGTGAGMLNWSVVPMHRHAASLGITPIDAYYAYYSSDHDAGDGGIYFATAPTPMGPWTRQGAAGRAGAILVDGANRQTETPVVNYDPDNNRLLMIYQVYLQTYLAANWQTSRVAESTDGVTWAVIGDIYDWTSSQLGQLHARHTGYMSWGRDPLGVVPGWVGWSRMYPDITTSICATTRSIDGVHWEMDFLPIYFPFLAGNINDTRIVHNHGYATAPFAYQGQRLLPVAPFRVSESGPGRGYIAIVRLGDDMRNMSAEEVVPFDLDEPGIDGFLGTIAGVMVEDNMVYLYYQLNSQSIYLATADLSKDPEGNARAFWA